MRTDADRRTRTAWLLPLLLSPLAAARAEAAETLFGDFAQFATADNVQYFAKDIGGIIGSGTSHTGRILGFAGFSAGFHDAYQFKPDIRDEIMNKSGTTAFQFPFFQAEIGLPLKFDGFIRGFSYEGLTVAGGGLRYGIFTVTDLPGAPQALLALDGESFVHTAFAGSHFGADIIFSVTMPYCKPYIGGGVDRTRLLVKQSPDPTLDDQIFITYGSRFDAGVTINPLPFTFVNIAGTLRHGSPGLEMGAGARF